MSIETELCYVKQSLLNKKSDFYQLQKKFQKEKIKIKNKRTILINQYNIAMQLVNWTEFRYR